MSEAGISQQELFNFKSYYGKHVVGPFKSFTCIVGPNGSGKSNITDAITFVLGSATSKMRAESLKDQVCSIVEDGEELKEAYVELKFLVTALDTRVFRRAIVSKTRDAFIDKFYFNEAPVSRSEYLLQQSMVGFMDTPGSQGPSCLIAQNEVETLLSRTPQKFSQYIEGLAGGSQQGVDYQAKLKEIMELENELQMHIHMRSTSWRNRKQASTEADAAHQYEVTCDSLSNTMKIRDTLSVAYKEKFLNECIVEQHTTEERQKKAKIVQEEHTTALDGVVKTYARSKRKLTQQERERGELQSAKREWERKLHRAETQKSFLEKKKMTLESKIAEQVELQQERQREKRALESDIIAAEERVATAISAVEKSSAAREKEDAFTADYSACMQVLQSSGSAQIQEEQATVSKDLAISRAGISACEMKLQSQTGNLVLREESIRTVSARLTDVQARLVHAQKTYHDAESELATQTGKKEQSAYERVELEKEYAEIQRHLAHVTGGERSVKREAKVHAALGGLYSAGDVLGKQSKFVHPIRAEHGVAVARALQGKLEHVLVRDKASAKRALDTLKEQQAGTVTQVPLDVRVDLPGIDAVRKTLPEHMFMQCDQVKSEQSYENAILWACGTCVVAQSMDDARRFAFKNEKRVKVVTIDGDVIHPSGAMSGGGSIRPLRPSNQSSVANVKRKRDTTVRADSSSTSASANNTIDDSNDNDPVELETRKAAVLKKLQALREEEDLSSKTSSLQGKLHNSKSSIVSLESNIVVLQSEQTSLQSKVKQINLDLLSVQADLDKQIATREKLTEKQTEQEIKYTQSQRKVLVGLAKKMGIEIEAVGSTIRQFAEHREELKSQQSEAQRHQGVLQSRLELIQKDSEIDHSFEANKKQVVEDQATLEAIVKDGTRELKKQADRDSEQNKVLSLETAAVEKIDRERRNALYVAEKDALQIAEQHNKIAVHDSTVKAKQAEQVEAVSGVVRAGGTIVQMKKEKTKARKAGNNSSSSSSSSNDTINDANDELINLQSLVANMTTEDICEQYRVADGELETLAELGYTVSTNTAQVETLSSLRKQISELEAKQEKLAPHGDAGVQLDNASEKFDAARQALAVVNNKLEVVSAELKEIGVQRRLKFDAALASLQKHSGKVFQTVCGGTLMLVPLGDSFNGGVALTVSTLGKRARDAVQLSGGEQALVGVALSVGAAAVTRELHGASDEGPIVVDEIDAAMDAGNVMRVGKLLSLRSKSGGQCVAVSLKETLFSQADALIGVYRDERGRSQVCTLDLEQYNK